MKGDIGVSVNSPHVANRERNSSMQIRRLGWQPDLPDHRDLTFSAPMSVMAKLPASVDLRSGCPPVYDQGQIGSCTANAIAGAIEFDQRKQKLTEFVPSRLFIYYNERDIEHTIPLDNGAQIRDGIKSVAKLGVARNPCGRTQMTIRPRREILAQRALTQKSLRRRALQKRSSIP